MGYKFIGDKIIWEDFNQEIKIMNKPNIHKKEEKAIKIINSSSQESFGEEAQKDKIQKLKADVKSLAGKKTYMADYDCTIYKKLSRRDR